MSQQHAPERSIFGIDPLDDFATIVADWIWSHGQHKQNLEIEGKVGLIIDTETDQRVQLPVSNETIVDLPRTRFESKMSISQHAHYNRLLNNLVSRSIDPSYPGAKVDYKRRKEIDYLHPAPGGKVRVTRDAETLAIKPDGIIQKHRIADINVHCPNRAFDFRISINTENPAQEPTTEHTSIREKNRLSYSHQNFVVDLTQVSLPEKPHEQIHELEVEFKDVDFLMQAAHQYREASNSSNGNSTGVSQDWTPFDDQVLIFLNNVRLLIRNASPAEERR